MDRWDCCDAGHAGRFGLRCNGREIAAKQGRQLWWPTVNRALGLVGWLEHDVGYGDPGNPKLNLAPVVDAWCGPLDDPLSHPVRLLAGGAGPHVEATGRGFCLRRVDGPGQIALAEYDGTGRQIDVHAVRKVLTDPSWSADRYVWCEDGALAGDGFPLSGVPGVPLFDPRRRPDDSRTVAVLAFTTAGWGIGVLTLGGFPYFAIAPTRSSAGRDVYLGPPQWLLDEAGTWRTLVQRAVRDEVRWYAASQVPGRPETLRTEWAEAGAAVRFPVVA